MEVWFHVIGFLFTPKILVLLPLAVCVFDLSTIGHFDGSCSSKLLLLNKSWVATIKLKSRTKRSGGVSTDGKF